MADPTPDAPTIESRDDLEEVFDELADINTELNRKQATQKKAIRRAKKNHKPRIEELTERLKAYQSAVKDYCRANGEQLKEDAGSKTITLLAGKIQFRTGRETVVFEPDKETVIERLQRADLGHLVNKKLSVSKSTIKKHRGEVEDIKGIRIERGEEKIKLKPD
jgi:phage host-nuclease inhibitor protein Gam